VLPLGSLGVYPYQRPRLRRFWRLLPSGHRLRKSNGRIRTRIGQGAGSCGGAYGISGSKLQSGLMMVEVMINDDEQLEFLKIDYPLPMSLALSSSVLPRAHLSCSTMFHIFIPSRPDSPLKPLIDPVLGTGRDPSSRWLVKTSAHRHIDQGEIDHRLIWPCRVWPPPIVSPGETRHSAGAVSWRSQPLSLLVLRASIVW